MMGAIARVVDWVRARVHAGRFWIERLLLRGLGYRLLLAAVIIITVSVVAGGVLVLLDDDVSDLAEAVWWAFLRLTDPGYLGDDKGIVGRTVSTVVTVLGYLLFLGLLIAILTQWLYETIRKLESGLSPVRISGHVIVLGWTQRTAMIVEKLLRTGPRAERFLERHHVAELRVVILAEDVDLALLQELRERLGEVWTDRQVVLRSGSPLRLEHLERAAFREAAAIILPGADFADRHPAATDAEVVKTLLSVSRNAMAASATPPLAVAALSEATKIDVAREAYAGRCEVVAADNMVSQIIAQAARTPGVWSVLSELFTLHVGNAFYVRAFGGKAAAAFGDLRRALSGAILIGVLPAGDERPIVNAAPDLLVNPGDVLLLIANSYDGCVPGVLRPRASPSRKSSQPQPPVARHYKVLVLGWSRKVPELLRDFDGYGDTFAMDVMSGVSLEDRNRTFSLFDYQPSTEQIRHIERRYTSPGALEQLDLESYDSIVLLASERLSDEDEADAASVLGHLMLRRRIPADRETPHVLVELLDEDSRDLFTGNRDDFIVSSAVVSHLLSQVTLRPELAALYSELFRPLGPQIVLYSAAQYLPALDGVRFADVAQVAEARGETALGLRRWSEDAPQVFLNPDRSRSWTLSARDEVVVLASYAEHEQ